MEKTHKKVFGILGLSLVAGMTAVAITLPNPSVSATTNVTDQITVQVVGSEVAVEISPSYTYIDPDTGLPVTKTFAENVVEPGDYAVTVTYQNIKTLQAIGTYTDENGDSVDFDLGTSEPDYTDGSVVKYISPAMMANGYGRYIVTVTGYGNDYDPTDPSPIGFAEESYAFSYYPAIARKDDSGELVIDQADDDDIDHVRVTIVGKDTHGNDINYDENFVDGMNDEGLVDYFELPDGDYQIKVTAYDASGNVIYKTFVMNYTLSGSPHTGAPDTGFFFRGGLDNISEDYIISMLIVFFVFGVVAMGIIVRKSHSSKRRR
jgi:hypothetical protein